MDKWNIKRELRKDKTTQIVPEILEKIRVTFGKRLLEFYSGLNSGKATNRDLTGGADSVYNIVLLRSPSLLKTKTRMTACDSAEFRDLPSRNRN